VFGERYFVIGLCGNFVTQPTPKPLGISNDIDVAIPHEGFTQQHQFATNNYLRARNIKVAAECEF